MLSTTSVLLDLDGTLIDSQPGILASCCAALRALGHEPIQPMNLETIIGPPVDDVMRILLRPYHDDRVAEAVAAYRTDYGATGLYNCTPYPGIPETLTTLHAAGIRLFLATSKRTIFARRILDHLGLAVLFEGIHGSEPGGALDDKPELIAHILNAHALHANDCAMIGDRRYDVVGAHANYLRAVGVLWGYGTRAELEAAGADSLAQVPTDLLVIGRCARSY